jgi:type IX secretion system PorP/SprF family membrane protein
MLKHLFFIFIFLITSKVYSQDAQYSMYYANPLYLNPAFTGATSGQRFVFNHRNQWPNIPITYQTYSASYDINAPVLHSGFGIQFNGDKAGTVGLKSSQINLLYAYKFYGNGFVFSPAVSFGIGNRSLDYNKLIFGDQLSFNTTSQQQRPPTLDPALFEIQQIGYFDFSTGVLLYSKDFWLGFSGWHLNKPNRTFLNNAAYLPMKISIHAGFKFELGNHKFFKTTKKQYLMPSVLYLKQGQFDQLNISLQLLYEPVIIGISYRGIAIRQNVADQMSNDAVVVNLGFKTKKYDIFYSYDATISKLSSASGGSHEVAFKYNFNADLWKVKQKKKMRYIPCPAF